ncbi:hypothetical protein, partial [Synechococcus sp. H55.8]|uniref:hypothetical protein n=1 Tax=Synechococcus sp. H55.8 TaxID=2964510 RepID=UPI0039C18452
AKPKLPEEKGRHGQGLSQNVVSSGNSPLTHTTANLSNSAQPGSTEFASVHGQDYEGSRFKGGCLLLVLLHLGALSSKRQSKSKKFFWKWPIP